MTLKLGCQWPPKEKPKIKLSSVLNMKQLFVPTEYDAEIDLTGGILPGRMWYNDVYGDCVIAAQANLTRVLEYIEQGKIINITDHDVKAEYFEQSKGEDNGLYMMDAFKHWCDNSHIYCILS